MLVKTEKVCKLYQQDSIVVNALSDVDLAVGAGEFMSLVGPSGSGKTTLLNLIGGLDSPTSGRIWIRDTEIGKLSRAQLTRMRRKDIGFIFQEYNLIPVLSALENVEYVMLLQGVPDEVRQQKAIAILEEVGLADFIHRRPPQLSGGQQQRVAVARAIVSDPAIVLADEPTANLDSKTGAALLDMMRELNTRHNTTFIFSTHDPMVMERAKRIVTLKDGKVFNEELRTGTEA